MKYAGLIIFLVGIALIFYPALPVAFRRVDVPINYLRAGGAMCVFVGGFVAWAFRDS